MTFDPEVWGPKYWFVLHTIAMTYPKNPNDVVKKKYYNFFINLPLFLPVQTIGNTFSNLLDKYPVTPYLDSRESLIKWVHFIHNKINEMLGKKTITLEEAMTEYYKHYKPKEIIDFEIKKSKQKIIYAILFILCIISLIYLYRK